MKRTNEGFPAKHVGDEWPLVFPFELRKDKPELHAEHSRQKKERAASANTLAAIEASLGRHASSTELMQMQSFIVNGDVDTIITEDLKIAAQAGEHARKNTAEQFE